MRIVPRTLWQVLPLIVVLLLASGAGVRAQDAAAQNREALTVSSWRSQSLRDQTAIGPNGAVTTAEALTVNRRMGAEVKAVNELAPGLYSLAGWGIGISYAIDAPVGWIIIDTGDTTTAAAEMRAMLEKTLGRRVKVAAILLTHWHYGNGIAAWRDPGTELWGHERLDANREMEAGLSPFTGVEIGRAHV